MPRQTDDVFPKKNWQQIGYELMKARNKAGLSAYTVARNLGCVYNYIYRIEYDCPNLYRCAIGMRYALWMVHICYTHSAIGSDWIDENIPELFGFVSGLISGEGIE